MSDYTKPGETHVKDSAVLAGLMEYRFEPILIAIQKYIIEKYGAVITESFRPKLHINDLHGTIPVRALDNRTWCYPDDVAYKIQTDINNKWEYDPARPKMECCVIHKNRKGGEKHIHLQTHPNTRLRRHG